MTDWLEEPLLKQFSLLENNSHGIFKPTGHFRFKRENPDNKRRNMVTLEDFKKLEIIVAQIKDVKEHPNADRLYVLKVDTGKEVKQLVAGIRKAYSKEELIGRRIVMINNLEPALIRGEESQGMILAATDENNLSVLGVEKEIAPGSMVK